MSAPYLAPGLPAAMPAPDGLDAGSWEGTRAHELRVQRCKECSAFQWGPEWICHRCLSFEMRWASVGCKIAEGTQWGTSLSTLFDAATIGGAKAFGRDDLGRLASGCKADLVLVDLGHPSMEPARDPLACLVFSALERPILDVYVDGVKQEKFALNNFPVKRNLTHMVIYQNPDILSYRENGGVVWRDAFSLTPTIIFPNIPSFKCGFFKKTV